MAGRSSLSLLDTFSQNRRPGTGVLRGSLRCEKAASSLEGGFASLLEGYGHSRRPCAKVLSVAGLLVLLSLFLPRRGEYPEVRKGPFLLADPTILNNGTKSVNPSHSSVRHLVPSAGSVRTGGLGSLQTMAGAAYTGWYGPPTIPGYTHPACLSPPIYPGIHPACPS